MQDHLEGKLPLKDNFMEVLDFQGIYDTCQSLCNTLHKSHMKVGIQNRLTIICAKGIEKKKEFSNVMDTSSRCKEYPTNRTKRIHGFFGMVENGCHTIQVSEMSTTVVRFHKHGEETRNQSVPKNEVKWSHMDLNGSYEMDSVSRTYFMSVEVSENSPVLITKDTLHIAVYFTLEYLYQRYDSSYDWGDWS